MKSHRLIIACSLVLCFAALLFFVFDKGEEGQDVTVPSAPPSVSLHAKEPQETMEKREAEAREAEELALRERIIALLTSGSPNDIGEVYNTLLPALVKLDPRAAAAFAQSPEVAKWHDDLLTCVVQSWAKINTDDAQAWAAQLPNPPGQPNFRDTMVSYVSFAVADTAPARAVQVLAQEPINQDRMQIMIVNLANEFAGEQNGESNLAPLITLVGNMPAGETRDGYYADIANSMAQVDMTQAAAIVSQDIAPGEIQDNAAINIVHQWAWNDPQGALAWVQSFPPGELSDLARATYTQAVEARAGINQPASPPP